MVLFCAFILNAVYPQLKQTSQVNQLKLELFLWKQGFKIIFHIVWHRTGNKLANKRFIYPSTHLTFVILLVTKVDPEWNKFCSSDTILNWMNSWDVTRTEPFSLGFGLLRIVFSFWMFSSRQCVTFNWKKPLFAKLKSVTNIYHRGRRQTAWHFASQTEHKIHSTFWNNSLSTFWKSFQLLNEISLSHMSGMLHQIVKNSIFPTSSSV